MIAEVLLVLAGHQSSIFPKDHHVHPAFAPLLHPGELQCLESLGVIATRYRLIKESSKRLSQSRSRYCAALCSTLNRILKDEYDALVVQTESKVLTRDAGLVASGSFVPLSSIRAIFAEWDAPLAALQSLMEEIESTEDWKPGSLINLLSSRSRTGIHRVADIFSRLSQSVQRVWISQLTAFIIHGTVSRSDGLASETFDLLDGSMPLCVSEDTKESIAYIGKAIGTVKAAKRQIQLPRSLAGEHTTLLESVLPEDTHEFDRVISHMRTNISEWLWMNVLTKKDVEDTVDSLANYFLIRNGEFCLSLIREIERLKLSRLTIRPGQAAMIREQDLNLALLRASLGTTAQHDPSLTKLHFALPSGPLRPLLPSLGTAAYTQKSQGSASTPGAIDPSLFNDLLLGTPLALQYTVSWPMDMFLHPTDLVSYATLFSYLSGLRRTHTMIHGCWTSLSNAQRARRQWTGLGEGGTEEDMAARKELLRCGWGIVRDLGWFLDTLLGYMMTDVVDMEYRRLRRLLDGKEPDNRTPFPSSRSLHSTTSGSGLPKSATDASLPQASRNVDFTTLRTIHTTYLDRLLSGCLLTNPPVTSVLSSIFELCDGFVAQIERWGGDVLPALLFEGSLRGEDEEVGSLVRERNQTISAINQTLHSHLEAFYEQLSLLVTPQQSTATDGSKSTFINASMANYTTFNASRMQGGSSDRPVADIRRHVERLMLRLDFNGRFSSSQWKKGAEAEDSEKNILAQGGL